jgi:hypothetical protein
MSGARSDRDPTRFAVLSFGRSGSTWLARALTRPESGMAAFHAPIPHVVGWILQHERDLASPRLIPSRSRLIEIVRPYSSWVRHRERELEVLGEVHLLLFFLFQQVPELLPPRRALLVRNGIQVTHAATFGWIWNGTPRERSWILGVLPPRYAQASADERLFAAVCAYWADHLAACAPLVGGDVLRLEDLTGGPAALQAAHARLTGREVDAEWCARVSAVKVNRCVHGDNSPANLFWNVWSATMREMFVELCGDAMASLGYALPARSAAPPAADLAPRRPRQETPLPFGPLGTLWCFFGNPRCGPVVVCGEPRYARVAARVLWPKAWLLDEDALAPGEERGGVKRIALRDVPRLQPAGVYIADPAPTRPGYGALRELLPHAEFVEMLPGSLSDDDLQRLEAAGPRCAEYEFDETTPRRAGAPGPRRGG